MNNSPRCSKPMSEPAPSGGDFSLPRENKTRQEFVSAMVEVLDDRRAIAISRGMEIGTIHRNQFGLWVSDTILGERYYSNPLPAAFDLAIVKMSKPKTKAGPQRNGKR